MILHTPFCSIDGTNTGMVTIPGEALSDLGTEIRNDLLNMKFDNVLLGGYGIKDTTCLTNIAVPSTQMATKTI